MHRLFGAKKKAAPPPPSLDDAASSLSTRQKNIDEKIKELDGELRRYNAQLKTTKGPAATNIKKRAMETLKRKRMYEQQRDQLSAQQFNVDQTNFAISTVRDSHVTIAAMKEASKTLKVEHKKININEIEDINDDLADMMEDMEEINEVS
jgi:charged multivesicular body protein 5